MAVVARLYFGDLPARSMSFCCERREEPPRRIFFRNAGNIGSWNVRFPIGWKVEVLLNATQTEIAQPRTYKITCLARLKSPEVKLPLPAR